MGRYGGPFRRVAVSNEVFAPRGVCAMTRGKLRGFLAVQLLGFA